MSFLPPSPHLTASPTFVLGEVPTVEAERPCGLLCLLLRIRQRNASVKWRKLGTSFSRRAGSQGVHLIWRPNLTGVSIMEFLDFSFARARGTEAPTDISFTSYAVCDSEIISFEHPRHKHSRRRAIPGKRAYHHNAINNRFGRILCMILKNRFNSEFPKKQAVLCCPAVRCCRAAVRCCCVLLFDRSTKTV